VDPTLSLWTTVLAAGGVLAGLGLLVRGLRDYRASIRVGDTSTSTISSLAAGEVRISGTIEPAEMTLVSLLQGVPCVYYRSTIDRGREMSPVVGGITEERSIGFRLRDSTGTIRVFPRGAQVDAAVRFDEETRAMGDEPPGLAIRVGGATQVSDSSREAAVEALLRVHDPRTAVRPSILLAGDRPRHYRETRLEPGDAVTIVGRALPFADLADPIASDFGTDADLLEADPEIAADLAEARAAGLLASDPDDAWGNAGIPGFGIGRPVSRPEIDPAANQLPIATPEEAAQAERIFDIAPDTLVLASSAEVPLLIAHGTPGAVMERSQVRYVMGLLGAVLAIASAMVFAITISGGVGL
jgi:hypothetical protein